MYFGVSSIFRFTGNLRPNDDKYRLLLAIAGVFAFVQAFEKSAHWFKSVVCNRSIFTYPFRSWSIIVIFTHSNFPPLVDLIDKRLLMPLISQTAHIYRSFFAGLLVSSQRPVPFNSQLVPNQSSPFLLSVNLLIITVILLWFRPLMAPID